MGHCTEHRAIEPTQPSAHPALQSELSSQYHTGDTPCQCPSSMQLARACCPQQYIHQSILILGLWAFLCVCGVLQKFSGGYPTWDSKDKISSDRTELKKSVMRHEICPGPGSWVLRQWVSSSNQKCLAHRNAAFHSWNASITFMGDSTMKR